MPYMPDQQTAERWGAAFATSLASDDPAIVRAALDTLRHLEHGLRADDDGRLVPVSPFVPMVRDDDDERGTERGPVIERSEPTGASKGIPQPASPTHHASRPTRSRKGRSSFVVTARGTAYVTGRDPFRDDDDERALVALDDVTLAAAADAWVRANHPAVDWEPVVGTTRGVSWEQVIDSEHREDGSDPRLPYLLAQHRTDIGGGIVPLTFPVGSHSRSDHREYPNHPRSDESRGWTLRDAVDSAGTYSAPAPLKRRSDRTRWTLPRNVARTDPTYHLADGAKRGSHRRTRVAVLADARGRRWTAGGTGCTERGELVTYGDRVAARRDVPRVEVRDERGQLVEVRYARTAVRTVAPLHGWIGVRKFKRTPTASNRDAAAKVRATEAREVRDAVAALPHAVTIAHALDATAVGERCTVDLPCGGSITFRRGATVTRYTYKRGERSASFTARTAVAAAMRVATIG